MYQNLRFELDAEGIALISIDVPERSVNVFTPDLIVDLRDVIDQIAQRADVRGAVFTSGKVGSFMVGADLRELAGFYARGGSIAEAMEAVAPGAQTLRLLERCGKPVAAAINGPALGGGYELCLACQHRVLLDERSAVVGLPEVTVGLLPAGGGTQRLPRLIGIERALPLMLSGRHVAPAEALALGMVDALAPAEQLAQAARQWVAGRVGEARQPWDVPGFRVPGGLDADFGSALAEVRRDTQDNYPAPLAILSAVYEGTRLPIDRGLAVEAQYFGTLLVSPIARNLMRTLFLHRGAKLRGAGDPGPLSEECLGRLRRVYYEEGLALLEAGASPALIANAARLAGFAYGPLQEDGSAHSNSAPAAAAVSVEEIGQRLLGIQAMEAARCLEDGIVPDAVAADLGAVLALGYPDWTGGTLSYIETVGLPAFVARCDEWADLWGERFRPSPWLRNRARADVPFHPTELMHTRTRR